MIDSNVTEAAIARLTLRFRRDWRTPGITGVFTRVRRRFHDGGGRAVFSLRALLLMTVAVAVMPAMLIAIVTSAQTGHAIRLAYATKLQRSARDLSAVIDHELTLDLATLSLLAGSGLDGPEFEQQRRLVGAWLGAPVQLRGADGRIHRPQGAPGSPVSDQPDVLRAVQQARARGRPVITDVIAPEAGMTAMAALVQPVMRPGGEAVTLEVLLPATTIGEALRRAALPEDEMALLVDSQGRIAAASRDEARLVGQIFHSPEGSGTRGWLLPEVPAPAAAALTEAPGWRVISRTSRDGVLLMLFGNPLGVSALAGLVAMLLSLGLVAALGERLTKPLRVLADMARNVAIGNDAQMQPQPASRIAEFEAVRQALLRADAVLRRRTAAERMALREARTGHELLVSVVNGTTESIYVKDLELRYVLVNRAALLNGPEPRAEWQVLGRSSHDLFPPALARRIIAADRTVLATGQLTRVEQDYIDPRTGEQRWLSITITPWQDAEGRVVGVVSVGRDTTEARRAEARMRGMQADLLRTTRLTAMGAMGSGLAHELNQPLAAATNFLNAGNRLLDRAVDGDPVALRSAREAVADGAQQLLRAGRIVRRLRDFVERGEVELRPQSLGDVLAEACDLARNDASLAGIELRLGECYGQVMVDRTQIQQVLLNLIRNAGEAISNAALDRPGDILVTATTRTGNGGGVCIEVSDNGPGLAPGIAERLFQPFVSSKTTGMGIGLAICRTIVEGHGGTLTAEAAPLGGMLFRITLPALHLQGELV